MTDLTLLPPRKMAESPGKTIAAQAHEIERLKAARNVPNTAAADLASILSIGNTSLKSDKHDLEAKNEALNEQIAAIAKRNSFLEAELAIASQVLQQAVPGELGLRQQNTILHTNNKTLEREKLHLAQQINTLQANNKTLSEDKVLLQQHNEEVVSLHNLAIVENTQLVAVCHEWNTYCTQQAKEITDHKENVEVMHGSLVRKAWRLHIQEKYLDCAGLVVKEFDQIDDAVIRAWAAENFGLPVNTDGSKDMAAEVQVTPIAGNFDAVAIKQPNEHVVPK